MGEVPAWGLGVVALLLTFGPGVAAFFFVRWLNRRDAREKQAESDKAEALKKEKSEAASKLDQVLALVQKLEDQMQSLALRLQAADQLSHQLKGAIDKVEERVDGQGADHKARLQALEALTQRLDERTRIDELTRDTKRRR